MSVVECEKQLLQAVNIAREVRGVEDRIFDIFYMDLKIIEARLSCLSVLAGRRTVQSDDLIFGKHRQYDSVMPSQECQAALYREYATNMCSTYKRFLPNADTSESRKIAKLLLRDVKALVCAVIDPSTLRSTEDYLLKAGNFADVLSILPDDLPRLKSGGSLEVALTGEQTKDWAAWMMAQYEYLNWFTQVVDRRLLAANGSAHMAFLFSSISQMRYMFGLRLKNIIVAEDTDEYSRLLKEYVDEAAGVITRGALSGNISSLLSFEAETTPEEVAESYEIIVEYLQGSKPNTESLAAAIILLQYAFLECLSHANKQLSS